MVVFIVSVIVSFGVVVAIDDGVSAVGTGVVFVADVVIVNDILVDFYLWNFRVDNADVIDFVGN